MQFWISNFEADIVISLAEAYPAKLPLCDCHRTSFLISQHCSGNGLVPSDTKPLPEPMLTQFFVTI